MGLDSVAGLAISAPSCYYVTKPYYHIDISLGMGQGWVAGRGVDMSEPDEPRLKPRTAFAHASHGLVLDEALPPKDILGATISYVETYTDAEEARFLYVHFKASYGLQNLKAALDRAASERKSSRSIYVLITSSGQGDSLSATELQWAAPPPAESLMSDQERLRQFLDDHGSHYIVSIMYGYRIAIRATLQTTDASEIEKFSGALKAAFGAVKIGAGITSEQRSRLTASNVNIICQITAGDINPPNSYVLTGFEQVADWLQKFREGEVQVKPGPIACELQSYWHTLDPGKHKKCRALLGPVEFLPPMALSGVPKGTILPWYPPPEAIRQPEGTGEMPTLVPPDGWAVCDGTHGTPDLTDDRFLMGCKELDAGKRDGENVVTWDHNHTFGAYDLIRAQGGRMGGGGSDQLKGTTGGASQCFDKRPKYFSVVYIMRMK